MSSAIRIEEKTYLRDSESVPSATEMIDELLSDHQICARTVRSALSIARNAVDAPTEDLMTQRLMAHEKAAWMLRSLSMEEKSSALSRGKVRTISDQ